MPRKNTATVSAWDDPDAAPEMTAAMFERAEIRNAGKLIRRGRPTLVAPKQMVSLRVDADVLAKLRAMGPGWQGRVNQVLREMVERRPG